jgi:hypothetical protein
MTKNRIEAVAGAGEGIDYRENGPRRGGGGDPRDILANAVAEWITRDMIRPFVTFPIG